MKLLRISAIALLLSASLIPALPSLGTASAQEYEAEVFTRERKRLSQEYLNAKTVAEKRRILEDMRKLDLKERAAREGKPFDPKAASKEAKKGLSAWPKDLLVSASLGLGAALASGGALPKESVDWYVDYASGMEPTDRILRGLRELRDAIGGPGKNPRLDEAIRKAEEKLGGGTTEPPAEPEPGPVEVDLVVLRADGSEVPDASEATEGMVVPANIDDDDGDGGTGADGANDVKGDRLDQNGVSGENDLIQVKVKLPATLENGVQLRFSYGAGVALWKKANKTEPLKSGEAFTAQGGTAFYVEGLSATRPEAGETITLEAFKAAKVLGKDEVKVHVTRSAFLLEGHGSSGPYWLRSKLGQRRYDARTNPTIVKGKDSSGKVAYWGVYLADTEKMAKIALSTEDSVIAYDGHSNFGMGFAFDTGFRKLSEFMNIADPQVPVNWHYLRDHQEHPQLVFSMTEYGDDSSTTEKYDPVSQSASVRGKHGTYSTSRFPLSGGRGTRYHLTQHADRSKPWNDHHYDVGGEENVRIVVKAGSRDMPAKKWAALFLNSCYSGPYYSDSFGGQGVLFFTHEEASASSTSGIFLMGFVDGKSHEEILTELNAVENINDYKASGG